MPRIPGDDRRETFMPGWTTLKLLALGHVLWGNVATALRLRTVRDGWRRIVGVGLREEHAKFAVAAFGLRIPKDGFGPALATFLKDEPEAKYDLAIEPALTVRTPKATAELAELAYAADGRLNSVRPYFDWPEDSLARLVEAVNAAGTMPEPDRPVEILHRTGPAGRRLLAASCVTIESVPEAERFAPPAIAIRRGLGLGVLTFVVRRFGDTCDVWAYAHHTGTDGVPLQELVSRLTSVWGKVETVNYPEPESEPVVRPCHLPGERPVYESLSFHDFSGLIAERKRLNATKAAGDAEVSVGGVFMTALAGEPEMKGVKFGSTVDVPASRGFDRGVGAVTLAPGEFDSIRTFANAYGAAVTACRSRKGPAAATIETAKHLPAWLHKALLVQFPEVTNATFGTVGLSILREGDVFVAPYADLGFPGGFLAIGNVSLPTASGRRVGCVSVKGDRETVERVPAVIRQALGKLAANGHPSSVAA